MNEGWMSRGMKSSMDSIDHPVLEPSWMSWSSWVKLGASPGRYPKLTNLMRWDSASLREREREREIVIHDKVFSQVVYYSSHRSRLRSKLRWHPIPVGSSDHGCFTRQKMSWDSRPDARPAWTILLINPGG